VLKCGWQFDTRCDDQDDVLVTEDGIENFTICPRTVEDVERVMAGTPWPPEPVVKAVKSFELFSP
jgi:hypothetical protein